MARVRKPKPMARPMYPTNGKIHIVFSLGAMKIASSLWKGSEMAGSKGELSLSLGEVAALKLEMAWVLAVRRGRKRGSQKSHRSYACAQLNFMYFELRPMLHRNTKKSPGYYEKYMETVIIHL